MWWNLQETGTLVTFTDEIVKSSLIQRNFCRIHSNCFQASIKFDIHLAVSSESNNKVQQFELSSQNLPNLITKFN